MATASKKWFDSDSLITGTIVEDSIAESGHIRIKFLALPGGCGPEWNLPRSLAEQMHFMLGKYLATGERQEQ